MSTGGQAKPKPKPTGEGRGHNIWTRWIAANKDRLPRFPGKEGKPGKINLTAAHVIFVNEYKASHKKDFKPVKPYEKRGPSIYRKAMQQCLANCKACRAEAKKIKGKHKMPKAAESSDEEDEDEDEDE